MKKIKNSLLIKGSLLITSIMLTGCLGLEEDLTNSETPEFFSSSDAQNIVLDGVFNSLRRQRVFDQGGYMLQWSEVGVDMISQPRFGLPPVADNSFGTVKLLKMMIVWN